MVGRVGVEPTVHYVRRIYSPMNFLLSVLPELFDQYRNSKFNLEDTCAGSVNDRTILVLFVFLFQSE